MHNDGGFEFFSLDFGDSKSGLHGSHVFSQAAFMNDALKAIKEITTLEYGECPSNCHIFGRMPNEGVMPNWPISQVPTWRCLLLPTAWEDSSPEQLCCWTVTRRVWSATSF